MTDVLTAPAPTAVPEKSRAGGVWRVLASQTSVHSGAAVATTLFPLAGAAGVVSLRLLIGSAVLVAVGRPRLRGYTTRQWILVGLFGAVLAGMNLAFYVAIARMPIGPVVTLEVLGPLTLSVVTARRRVAWLWALLALAGVALLGGGGFDQLDPLGVGCALLAGAAWACYIMLSARAGATFPKRDGLTLAMLVAALLALPAGLLDAGAALAQPRVLALGAAVAVLSSVLPYTFELTALRRLPTSTFAVLMSLGPAIAALMGWVLLGQDLHPAQIAAIGFVVAASAGVVLWKDRGSATGAAAGS
ncbi:DMT family transporter [Dactylosporangium sp. NPDC000521]|uniref:EamA family transporter n=1 Tax=Dactylosporangium sp. NPDC000521 TaxID=3363975 RepID=UPI0036ACAB14